MTDIPAILGGFHPLLGLCAMLAFVLGAVTAFLCTPALDHPGPDRERLITMLEQRGLRAIYVWVLTRALDRLDRLLGDAGRPELSLPSPFGNRQPAPYWTGPALDTCALLTIVYPLASMFVIWVATGDAGPIGEILGQKVGLEPGYRVLSALVVVGVIAVTTMQNSWLSAVAVAVLLAVLLAVPRAVALAVVGAGVVAVTVRLAVALAGTGAVAVAVAVAVASALAGGGRLAVAVAVAVVAGVVAVAVAYLAYSARERSRIGMFWSWFGILALLSAFLGLLAGAHMGARPQGLGLIALVAIVPLVNLPFDFASLGFTRALLRRGCEEDAPSPLWLGLLDLLLGAALMVLLGIALVAAMQAADALIAWGRGEPVLDLTSQLQLIAEEPGHPHNWWIYFTLFSTVLPSALNTAIGGFSLVTWGLPALREWMLRELRAAAAPGYWEGRGATRNAILLALSVQVGFSVLLAAGAFYGLFLAFDWLLPFALPALLRLMQWWAAVCAAAFGLPTVG